MHYDTVENYAMKCRLYPTKKQKEAIDNAITAVRIFHNCLVYDMFNNGLNLKERTRKTKDGTKTEELIHFPNWKTALSAEYKAQLISQHPAINLCPQGALTTDNALKADLKKEFGNSPIEYQKPKYYTERHPRLSYTYQEKLSKLHPTENRNTFRFSLNKIGDVKVRGWNKKLRFEDENTDFLQWAALHKKETITVIVSRDTVGDYFIVFKIKACLKPFLEVPESKVGIDVGISDIAITSDGEKFENPKYKKKEKRHQKLLNRKLSRRWGPSNEVYRDAREKNRAELQKYYDTPEENRPQAPPEPIQPSKQYNRAKILHAKLNRKISRQREQWNHYVSRRIVEKNSIIAVETLNISGMVRNKHLSYALTDAAFGTLLSNIKYKADWHGRDVQSIDKWTPSSKRCSCCGYIYNSKDEYHLKPWGLSIREWSCPVCKTRHDRDINAAKNILFYAEQN